MRIGRARARAREWERDYDSNGSSNEGLAGMDYVFLSLWYFMLRINA